MYAHPERALLACSERVMLLNMPMNVAKANATEQGTVLRGNIFTFPVVCI